MVERRALDPYSDALRLALLKFWIDLLSSYESTNSDKLIEPSFHYRLYSQGSTAEHRPFILKTL